MTSSLAWLLAPAVLTAGFSLPLVDRLVFFPDRAMPDTPAGVEDRWITTEDGIRIHAWYLAAPEPDAPTVLWAHGNGGNIGGRYEVQATLARRGLNVLAYDYRGYGRSEGSPSEAGAYLDSHAVFDSKARVGGLRVPYFGAHGDRDEIVDFALGEALFVAAPEPKEFLRIDGAGHNDIFQYPQVADGIAAFARRVSHIAREEPSP